MLGDMKEENSSGTDDDEASKIPCERERAMDVNGSGSANATEDIGMKKTMDSNEELETKKGQSYTTCGSSINSSSPSACHTSQPSNKFVESTPSNKEAFDHNKKC